MSFAVCPLILPSLHLRSTFKRRAKTPATAKPLWRTSTRSPIRKWSTSCANAAGSIRTASSRFDCSCSFVHHFHRQRSQHCPNGQHLTLIVILSVFLYISFDSVLQRLPSTSAALTFRLGASDRPAFRLVGHSGSSGYRRTLWIV